MELQFEQVTVRYGEGREALRQVTARFTPGLWVVLGPNGAGKTTLLRTAATLIRPSDGRVSWNGMDSLRHPQQVLWHLGYAPQEPEFPADVTAAAYLDYLAALKGVRRSVRRERVEAVLELVRLTGHARRCMGDYSAGMKSRLALAQALLNDPDLLLLDEPAAWLDPVERRETGALLADLARQRVVLVSTHMATDFEGYADGVLLIDRGEVRFMGAVDDLREGARGRVWTGVVPAGAPAGKPGAVLARRRVPGGEAVRVVAPEPPFPGAEPAEPTLEDAYVHLMQS